MPATSSERARAYKQRHRLAGLCIKCDRVSFEGDRCFMHLVFYELHRMRLTTGVLSKIMASRRAKLVAALWGRYSAIKAGHLQAATMEEAVQEAFELRARLKITWAGTKGLKKTARMIRKVDRWATKERQNATADQNN